MINGLSIIKRKVSRRKNDFFEAGAGIEPAHRCFADTRVSTSPSGREFYFNKKGKFAQSKTPLLSKTPPVYAGGVLSLCRAQLGTINLHPQFENRVFACTRQAGFY